MCAAALGGDLLLHIIPASQIAIPGTGIITTERAGKLEPASAMRSSPAWVQREDFIQPTATRNDGSRSLPEHSRTRFEVRQGSGSANS